MRALPAVSNVSLPRKIVQGPRLLVELALSKFFKPPAEMPPQLGSERDNGACKLKALAPASSGRAAKERVAKRRAASKPMRIANA